jgi:RNA polymerase sigma-70 factor (ECF subfamily)
MEDNETTHLMESAAAGDVASWGSLLTEHVERLARFIAVRLDKRLQSRIDAQDVIQEIYTEAWQHLPAYRSHGKLPFYLWLRGLARNKLYELHRYHLGTKMRDARREATDYQRGFLETTTAALSSLLIDRQISPSSGVARDELRARVQDAVETMDELDREVLALRHFEQLSNAETAQVLDIKEKAASMRYIRALRRLRELLAALPGGTSGFRL